VHATRARLVERYMPNDRYSLTEVSQLLGLGAPSAFTRWFHERFSISPSDWRRAARHARRAADLQDPHFTRNIALYTAELADDLARGGHPDEGAAAGLRVLELLGEVQSSRIRTMLAATARVLLPHRRASGVSAFLERHASMPRTA